MWDAVLGTKDSSANRTDKKKKKNASFGEFLLEWEKCMLSHFSCIWLFVTLWTVTHQASLSMGFSRQEYRSGSPCSSPRNLPHPGIEPMSACNTGDPGSIPGSGRSPGERNGNPLQDSCLENPMDREAWWVTVHGVTKSRTQLSDFTLLLQSMAIGHVSFSIWGTWVQ